MDIRKMVLLLMAISLIAVPAATWSFSMKTAGDQNVADGATVYKFITEKDPYTKWPLWPGKGKLYKGQHPHGAFLTTYVSKKAVKTIEKKRGSFPNGTIIVKENYMPDKKLAAVTVMYRVKGYDPDAGDWFWAKYKADGTIEKEGKVKGCIDCHSAQIMNDWVFTGPIK